ncbi:GDSL esterase/lipase [Smittium culicis]|uniref:GDSL esterase/lipase n=1 Tax=Smittium culicis TaxID=133412 RepID=A0A1R1WXI8_9FUNG|nr:GDSL esterase/lipase [Smittium culicis]
MPDTVKRMVVFGDSNADTGNMQKLSNGTSPGSASFKGRYCEGQIFTDLLSEKYNIQLETLAYGGATINNDNVSRIIKTGKDLICVPGAKQQIERYFAAQRETSTATDLHTNFPEKSTAHSSEISKCYLLYVGSNDFTSEMFPDMFAETKRLSSIERAAEVRSLVDLLVSSTPETKVKIIVVGMRPREDYPGIVGACSKPGSKFSRESVQSGVVEFNTELKSLIDEAICAHSSKASIVFYDIYSRMKQIASNASIFGFDNDTSKTFSQNSLSTNHFSDPVTGNFLFWDSYHLGHKAQIIIMQDLENLAPDYFS